MWSSAGRDVAPDCETLRRLLPQDRRHRLGAGVALERLLAREHLVEHRAEREDVRAVIHRQRRAPARATCSPSVPMTVPGSVVPSRRSASSSRPSMPPGRALARRPKSRILTWPSRVTKMFSGFRSRWTMPFVVRGGEALARSAARSRPPSAAGAARRRAACAQRLALEQLHDGEGGAVVRCRSRGWRGCSDETAPRRPWPRARTARARRGRRRGRAGRTLMATSRFELRVARAVDLAHAAGADRREDLVGTEIGSGGQCHEVTAL